MLPGNENVLDRIVFSTASPGVYWHVYNTKYAPTSSNHYSKARLAWSDGSHGMFYTGATPAAALWETVLRYAEIDGQEVYTHPHHLKGMALVRLTLLRPVPAIDLRAPYRRAVVDANTPLDTGWDHVLKVPDHDKTHVVTKRLMAQLTAAGYSDGAALIWHSRQAGSEIATLFFEPPIEQSWWEFDSSDIYELETPEGERQIQLALAAQDLMWRSTPSGDGFDPPPEQ